MPWPKGRPRPPNSGRKKGVCNRVTADMRDQIREAFDRAGGVEYLVALSESDPRTFIAMVRAIVPRELEVEATGKGWEQILAATLERSRENPRPPRREPEVAPPTFHGEHEGEPEDEDDSE